MALIELEILERGPYEEGRPFGVTGAYERIEAVAHYAVDPTDAANGAIVDLQLADRDADGRVRFSGDATLLLPADRDKANRGLLVEAPNRGNRVALRSFNLAPFDLMPTSRIDPGDGFLLERGWSVAWCGWQWDVPRQPSVRMGLAAPTVPVASDGGRMQLRIQPDRWCEAFPLTDHHVGTIGNHRPIAAADRNDPGAVLLVREHPYAEPEEVPRSRWRFARREAGEVVPDPAHLWLEGGFEPGRIYDLVYTPSECPVVGAGLLALRDFAAYLRADPSAPTAGSIDHVIGEGLSQCGRLLRTFLNLGLNVDERGSRVFDGVLVHIAGGRRGEFNHRYGQPSVQPTPSFGHLPPFADEPQRDPVTGRTAGLLDRQRELGGVPRIFYTDTASEYWRGDAGLAHLDLESERDVELPPEVRRYLFAGTQHGPGLPPLTQDSMFGSRGANHLNLIDYRPLFRAALANLFDWVSRGAEPPPSMFPRLSDGTAQRPAEVLETLAAIPGCSLPDPERLPAVRPIDLGPRAGVGIGSFPARVVGAPYPLLVSAVDADGNETGGIATPDLLIPVATHTGFNPRHPTTGGEGQVLEYLGSTVPFAATRDEREANRDPRPSIEERYRSRDDYLEQARAAARDLIRRRYLLEGDVERCVTIAAERYDACVESTPTG